MEVAANSTPAPPLVVGVSACILGREVRYDGGHKLDHFVRDTLGGHLRFEVVCPEVEVGMGTPREPIRIERTASDGKLHLVAPKSGTDHTAAMERFAAERCQTLAELNLSGFILKKGSPSCGMERVKVFSSRGGAPARNGRGFFAAALMETFPLLPVEEEGRLHDLRLREAFVEKLFAYARLKAFLASPWRLKDLVAFHSREKLLLLAHDRKRYDQLGQLVATAKGRRPGPLGRAYAALFMETLGRPTTKGKHANVLQHIAGHFKAELDSGDRQELVQVVDRFRRGELPLVVPITLLQHHLRRHASAYISQQSYLNPHPAELMLRNHV